MAKHTRKATKARAYGRSLSDFPKLNEAEKKVIECARKGELANFGDKIPETEKEKKTRTIRAGLVRFLALGGDDETPVHEQGVWVHGAIIDGKLDLEGCTLVGDLVLGTCDLFGTLMLRGALARSVNLGGSRCQNIIADRANITGSMFLRGGFLAQGEVRLLGAQISGDLDCTNGQFDGRDESGYALNCNGAQFGRYVFLNNVSVSQGAVLFLGAKVVHNLQCGGGRFNGRDDSGNALILDSIQVGGNIFLDTDLVAQGAVRLIGAVIALSLYCSGSRFEGRDDEGDALACDGIQVGADVFFTKGFAAQGRINLIGSTIGGDVVRWSRLSEQIFRVDKWSLYQG